MKASLVRDIVVLRRNEFYKTLSMLRAQVNLMIIEGATTEVKKYVTVEIPPLYVGREPYDPVEMGKALVDQLRVDGYFVKGTYLRFFVYWDQPSTKVVHRSVRQ